MPVCRSEPRGGSLRARREHGYFTRVNCNSSVRWIIEKLSSETMVTTVSPCGVTWASIPSMLSISSPRSASKMLGPSTTAPGASEASAMRRMRMPTPLNSENFRSSSSSSPEGSNTASLTSKLSVRRTLNCPGFGPPARNPMRLPLASRPRSEIAINVPASGSPLGTKTSASSPLLKGSFPAAGQRYHLATRTGEALSEIEPKHLVDAFEADINKRTVERDRLRVEPAARGDRLAVGAQHRRGLDVIKPGHLVALIDDAAGEPGALVAERDEALSFGIEAQSRQSAKSGKPRRQGEPAAIFQRPETHMRTVASIERGDRPGVDLDRDRCGN